MKIKTILKKITIKYNNFIEKRKKTIYINKILENKTYLNIIYDEITDELTSKKSVKNDIGVDYKLKGTMSEEMVRYIKIDKIKETLIKGDFVIEIVDIFKYIEKKVESKDNMKFPSMERSTEKKVLYEKDTLAFFKNDFLHTFYLEKNSNYVNNGFNILSDMQYSKHNHHTKKVMLIYRNYINGKYDQEGKHYSNTIYPTLIIIE